MKSWLFFLTIFPSLLFAGQDALWGKLTKLKAKNISYQYFISYQEEGRDYAYPLEVSSSFIKKELDGNIGKMVRIQGHLKMVATEIDGARSKTPVFKVQSVGPFSLSDLSINPESSVSFKAPNKKGSKRSGGMTLNDTVTNTLIFTGGAILMGTVLKNMLKKGK